MVVKRAITCGISSDEYTEVLDGITEEDQIIVNSLTGVSLEEGMAERLCLWNSRRRIHDTSMGIHQNCIDEYPQ